MVSVLFEDVLSTPHGSLILGLSVLMTESVHMRTYSYFGIGAITFFIYQSRSCTYNELEQCNQ
jgi:hypothetical protein